MRIKRREFLTSMAGAALAFMAMPATRALAGKSVVRIEAPATAALGESITVTLHVSHNGNNFFHYTNLAYVTANGQDAGRWEFSASARPEDETFTRQVTLTVNGDTELTAEANCNLHGSAGKAVHRITAA